MAEHLSMMENSDIGFAVRDYFIDVEKDWRARGGSLLSSRIVDLETLIDQRAEKKFQQLMTGNPYWLAGVKAMRAGVSQSGWS